jgi:hypothetical protein
MNLLVPAVLVGGYLFVNNMRTTGEAIKKCEISAFKLGKLSIGAQQTTIPVELSILNPNNRDVPAEYFRGVVYRAGIKIADFTFDSKDKAVMLKKRTTTPLTFNIRITTIGAVRNIIDVFKNLLAARPIDSVFTVKGVIVISGFDIPVDFTWDVAKNKSINQVSGIGKPYAKMEFNSNAEMKAYFKEGCRQKLPGFSKN